MDYKSNKHVAYSCKYHVVFCPRYRRKVLEGAVATRLKAIIREVMKERRSDLLEMEVMPDNVHLLLEVDPQ
jgi:putative transposase